MERSAKVGIIMGSLSDLETMRAASTTLAELDIPHEMRVVSAHRTPDLLFDYASTAAARGLKVIIAGAGGAAHLPGMTASKTQLPVIGVPVAAMAVGNATNAALFAARILALEDDQLLVRLRERSAAAAAQVEAIKL